MAVALGFSVLFATLVTLILVPCMYVMLQDMAKGFKRLVSYNRTLTDKLSKSSEQ
jgi:hypothetical protein